eukprot:SAG31_NODE_4563_length_3135_cov_6.260359_4_plen_151_part_01
MNLCDSENTLIVLHSCSGCEGWGDYLSAVAHNGTTVDIPGTVACEHEEHPWAGVAYFLTYVTCATALLMNLFVGIIVDSMMQLQTEAAARVTQAKEWAAAKKLAVGGSGPSKAASLAAKVGGKLAAVGQYMTSSQDVKADIFETEHQPDTS